MKRYILFFLTIFFVVACSSSEDPSPAATESISLLTKTATPGQIVISQAADKPEITSTSVIKVGELDVQVFAGDSNQVLFIMPVLASGNVVVNYSGIGISKQLDLTVGAYTTITNPAAVANSFTTELDAVAKKLQAYVNDPIIQLDPAYIAVLNQQNQAVKENFSKLTAEEQLKLAYMLQSITPDESEFSLDEPDPNNYRINNTADPGEEIYRTGKNFVKSMIAGSVSLFLGTQLAMLPSPLLFDKVAAAACMATSVGFFVKAHSEAQRIALLKGVAETILESFSGNRVGVVIPGGRQAAADETVFNKDKAKVLTLNGEYRTLVKTDAGSSVAFFATTFKYLAKMQESYNTILATTNKIKSWFFGSGPSIPEYKDPIKTQAAKKELPLPSGKVAFKNISDAKIQLSATPAADGKFNLVATSTATGLQDKPFSFDVLFTDNNLGVLLTKKVTAIYRPAQPHAVSLVDGNNQEGEPGKLLAKPLKVKVIDADGNALKDIEVEWTVKSGNGTLSAAKTVTDAQGMTEVTWKMHQTPSADQRVEAMVRKGDGTLVNGAPVAFKATLGIVTRLINGSPWKLTSYIVDGEEQFNFKNLGNKTCYPAGIYDKTRFVEGTFSFSSTTLTKNIKSEEHTYNCNAKSFDISYNNNWSGAHQWKIDKGTGKLVFMNDGQEEAWLAITIISDTKIRFDGIGGRGEDEMGFSFEIED
ncbi:Ig-like domain-containing protein [Pontibacter pudoricolor]|uniref:Ig-like domain-containing protein n=1 Tax=Pontibacter pudoricolor TaxID=2694930 RepID=UPI00139168C3|nr:Ig-like domain-containing protein [Pontibacter pudoricolor]